MSAPGIPRLYKSLARVERTFWHLPISSSHRFLNSPSVGVPL